MKRHTPPQYTALTFAARHPTASALIALVLLALGQVSASGAPTTLYQVQFTGELTSVSSSAPFWSGIAPGTPFSVTASYDDDPTSSYLNPDLGIHLWNEGLYALTASFGAYTFSVPAFDLEIRNDGSGGMEGFIFGNAGSFTSNGLNFTSGHAFRAYLMDFFSAFDRITDTSVQAVGPFDVADFGSTQFGILNGTFNEGADTASVEGTVTSYSFSSNPVPEPSTYALLAMSAAGALWWARRRR